jgi:hypothetical protein
MPKKVKAARLVLGGAPESWHTVVGLPGHFHPTLPTPLDQPGLPTLEQVAGVPRRPQGHRRARRRRLAAAA